jgi:hypothetical protein
MSQPYENTLDVRRSDGSIDMELLAKTLNVQESELVSSVGLSGQGVQEVQCQLNEAVQLLDRVTPWAGTPRDAYQWFCSQPIAELGGKTAKEMVRAGRASVVQAHLDRIAEGGYA